MSNLKQLFSDVNKGLNGQILEDTFQVGEMTVKMRLVNANERAWAYSYITGSSSGVGTALQVQIPLLAIGIREINGHSMFSFFEEEFKELEDKVQKVFIEAKNGLQFYCAELLYEMLCEQPPEIVDELSARWRELENRKKKAEDAVKK